MNTGSVLQLIIRDLPLVMTVVEEDWDQLMSVNLRGVMLCFKYSARQMIKQQKGECIIGTVAYFFSNEVPLETSPSQARRLSMGRKVRSLLIEDEMRLTLFN